MRRDYVIALIRAHASGDAERFRVTALQVAAQIKNRREADEVRRLVSGSAATPVELPPDQRSLWSGRDPMPRPWYPGPVGELVDELLTEWPHRIELRARGVRPASRLLLSGPPGCGKTMTATYLGGALGLSAYVARLTELVDSFMGATAARVYKALGAVGSVPAVWVLDELDAIASRRGGDTSGAGRERDSLVNALCVLFDDLTEAGLVVATTNRVDALDPAVVRRFDQVIEWPEPSAQDLAAFAEHLGAPRPEASYAETVYEARRAERRRIVRELSERARTAAE